MTERAFELIGPDWLWVEIQREDGRWDTMIRHATCPKPKELGVLEDWTNSPVVDDTFVEMLTVVCHDCGATASDTTTHRTFTDEQGQVWDLDG